MSLSQLIGLISPPNTPEFQGDVQDENAVAASLGTPLPDDYLAFGHAFGSGRFCNEFIRVFNPFSPEYIDLVNGRLSALRSSAEQGELDRYPVFPTPDGLLPWGDDENGNILGWLTRGSPDQWVVAIREQGNGVEVWEMSFSEFLCKAFQNQIDVAIWDEPFQPEELNFELS